MKKIIKYISFLVIVFFLIMPCVCAAELSKKYVVCHDVNVLKGLRVLGYVVLIVKVLVPVVLIITGMYAFFKAMVASDERERCCNFTNIQSYNGSFSVFYSNDYFGSS